MTERKWTKGPWRVYPTGNIENDEGEYVGHIAYFKSENGRANAHLIAAAPEMFEIVKQYLQHLEGLGVDAPSYEATAAAFSKARGET